ncbi:MAG TPA: hypothetical protein VGQ81_14070 [Acidobacteriota bacterium]|jgi:hypothetical protein|nr:hypothetical protein [Acidobacteriota bacterium]
MGHIPSSLVLKISAFSWFAIGLFYLIDQGIPQMIQELRTFAPIRSNLEKRDLMFPGWAECVTVVKEKVPVGADLLFVSSVEEERYGYLHVLLDYEIYPLRNLFKTAYLSGERPRFVLIYLQAPKNFSFVPYRTVYESPRVRLLERK